LIKKSGAGNAITNGLPRKTGDIVLDQIRTVDKTRLLKLLDKLNDVDASKVSNTLIEMFSI
jgi:mRNA-degrading endonuclease toxin of MazEF toxin-antitoxin module